MYGRMYACMYKSLIWNVANKHACIRALVCMYRAYAYTNMCTYRSFLYACTVRMHTQTCVNPQGNQSEIGKILKTI